MKLLSSITLTAFLMASAGQAAVISSGHADIGIGYDLTEGWEPHVHGDDREYEPEEVTFLVPESLRTSGLGSSYDLTGANGGNIWILPKDHPHGAVHLGFASEEIDAGIFLNNEISISVNLVSGPGEFSIWDVDGVNQPIFLYSSIDAGYNGFTLPVGSHQHFNLGFTELGDYEIEFTYSGFLNDESPVDPISATYAFSVVPEPSTYAAIFGLVVLGLAIRRRRK